MQSIFKRDRKYYRIVLDEKSFIYCDYDASVQEHEYVNLRFSDILGKIDEMIIFIHALAQTLTNLQDKLETIQIKNQLNELERKFIAQGDTITFLFEKLNNMEKK